MPASAPLRALRPVIAEMRRDPGRAPETLAIEAVRALRPAATARSGALETAMPIAGIVVSGASGFAGLAGLPLAAVSLWWVEAEIAMRAAARYAPDRADEGLAGDLLHLWGLVDDPAEAARIVRRETRPLWRTWATSRRGSLARILVRLLLRRGGRGRLAARGLGRSMPLVAVAVNAWTSSRELRAFSAEAERYYRSVGAR